MTLPELYQTIGGDYDQALRVLHIEKLIDKHIRKFPNFFHISSVHKNFHVSSPCPS